jgi:hypothetical protein
MFSSIFDGSVFAIAIFVLAVVLYLLLRMTGVVLPRYRSYTDDDDDDCLSGECMLDPQCPHYHECLRVEETTEFDAVSAYPPELTTYYETEMRLRGSKPHLYRADWYETNRRELSEWAAEQYARLAEMKAECNATQAVLPASNGSGRSSRILGTQG